jgi:hypothetical protein
MRSIGVVKCPNLKGSIGGSVCEAASNLITNMEGVEIKLCMSRHHEACSVYKRSLQNMIEFGSYSISLHSLEH